VPRYNAQWQTAAALASNAALAWMGYTVVPARLRRCTIGVANSGGTITSMQCQVGLQIATTGTPATPVNVTSNNMAPFGGTPVASTNKLISAWTTAPTLGAQSADAYTITFNDQLMGDLPWELLEEFWFSGPGLAAAGGIAFINRSGAALPGSHYFTLAVEWEE
jgi:hypothetical protein